MSPGLARLRHLTPTDPDPRGRRGAHVRLLLAEGHAIVAVTRLFAAALHWVRAWRSRFLVGVATAWPTSRGLAAEARCRGTGVLAGGVREAA